MSFQWYRAWIYMGIMKCHAHAREQRLSSATIEHDFGYEALIRNKEHITMTLLTFSVGTKYSNTTRYNQHHVCVCHISYLTTTYRFMHTHMQLSLLHSLAPYKLSCLLAYSSANNSQRLLGRIAFRRFTHSQHAGWSPYAFRITQAILNPWCCIASSSVCCLVFLFSPHSF